MLLCLESMDPQSSPPPSRPSAATTAITSLSFKVHRREPELISPAKPTPRELKLLSNIDNQDTLRFQIPCIQFYQHNPSNLNVDPVKLIRRTLAKTLVYFYPYAGRLREGPDRKLMVDCTGEGVIFIEADADVALDDFGEDLQPPFPCFEELLFDLPGSNGILHSPLLLMQVTRLKCGGFIIATRFNHTMNDGYGIFLFAKTLAEMARGANGPTIWPAWDRHLLSGRVLPPATQAHYEYNEVVVSVDTFPTDHMIQRSFFFGPTDISAIRRLLPPNLRDRSTTFEMLTSFLWRCRTIALSPKPDTKMQVTIILNVRNKFNFLQLPPGYYGNAIAGPTAVATVKDIIEQPPEYVLKLIQKTKYNVTEEYMKSVIDGMVPRVILNTVADTYVVSDLTRPYGFCDMDFGWGKAVYDGPAMALATRHFSTVSHLVSHKNKNGVEGIVVPISLPEPAMEKFAKELDRVLANKNIDRDINKLKSITSKL